MPLSTVPSAFSAAITSSSASASVLICKSDFGPSPGPYSSALVAVVAKGSSTASITSVTLGLLVVSTDSCTTGFSSTFTSVLGSVLISVLVVVGFCSQ